MVGIRELKNRLSTYIRAVSSGETVLVTDRGQVVAELAPPQRSVGDAGLADLARRGLMTRAATETKSYPLLPRAMKERKSSELLDLERGTF